MSFPSWRVSLGLVGIGIVAGMGLGWMLWMKPTPKLVAQPEVRQKDGSLILKTQPEPDAQAKKDIPDPVLPRGAKVERRTQVMALPHLPTTPTAGPAIPGSGSVQPSPTPIHINLALVKMPDGQQRVIASSPDATIVGGLDIPTESPHTVRDLKWLAGAAYNPSDRTYGAFVMREVGPVVVGVEVNQVKAPALAGGGTTLDGRITIGFRF